MNRLVVIEIQQTILTTMAQLNDGLKLKVKQKQMTRFSWSEWVRSELRTEQ